MLTVHAHVSIKDIRRLEQIFGNPHWLQILSHVAFVRLQRAYKNQQSNQQVTIL